MRHRDVCEREPLPGHGDGPRTGPLRADESRRRLTEADPSARLESATDPRDRLDRMSSIARAPLLLVLVRLGGGLLVACGAAAESAPPAASDGGVDGAPDGTGTDSATGDGVRTLESCATSIDPGAPEFYRTYFKCVTITMSGGDVVIATQSLPPHPSYYYGSASPNFAPFDTSRGPEYRANPNVLSAKAITITVPAAPVAKGLVINTALVDATVATSTEEYGLGPVGVALDSVALFNPLARPGDDIEDEKYTFDDYSAHPAPDGTYHYHQFSNGPLEVLESAGLSTSTTPGDASIEVYGIMCDGTVVLGCKELDGSAPDSAALDAQGGHVGDLVDASGTVHFPGRYHTHVCPTGRRNTPEIQYYEACER